MSYFIYNGLVDQVGQAIQIEGEEFFHMAAVRRFKTGETVEIQDKQQHRYLARVEGVKKHYMSLRILEVVSLPKAPKVKPVLFQAYITEKSFDFILQKSTELAVSQIITFNAERTSVKLSPKIFEKKVIRWQKICQEAAKQSGRPEIPVLKYATSFAEATSWALVNSPIILCAQGQGQPQLDKNVLHPALFVGPEGGFTKQEILDIKKAPNFKELGVGPYTLRSETAAIAGLVWLLTSF